MTVHQKKKKFDIHLPLFFCFLGIGMLPHVLTERAKSNELYHLHCKLLFFIFGKIGIRKWNIGETLLDIYATKIHHHGEAEKIIWVSSKTQGFQISSKKILQGSERKRKLKVIFPWQSILECLCSTKDVFLLVVDLGNRGMCREHEECGYWLLISSSTTRWLKNCGHWFFCLSGVSWVMTFCPDGVSITLEKILWQGRLMGQFGKCILCLGQLQHPPLKVWKNDTSSQTWRKKNTLVVDI